MPRGKKGTYALAESGDGGLAPVRVDGGGDGVPSVPSVQTGEDRTGPASWAFQQLLLRTDGWLRVVPAGEGKLTYFKWKYSSGRHKGKYVMFVAAYTDWCGGLLGLFEKVEEVDLGTRAPAQDTFYDPR